MLHAVPSIMLEGHSNVALNSARNFYNVGGKVRLLLTLSRDNLKQL